MKKKLLALTAAAMSVVFAFSFTACNGDNATTGGNGTHEHTYSADWSHNATEHWHACTKTDCDEMKDKAAHTWDSGVVTTEPTCTGKGEKTYTCPVCNATKTEELAAAGHTFSAKWESDETEHWHKCADCEEISGKAEHVYTAGVCACGHIQPNTDPVPEFNPIDTLDELYNTPKPIQADYTAEKYGANYELFYENAVREYNAAQDMQKAIYTNLENNVKHIMGLKTVGSQYDKTQISNTKWELLSSQNNNVFDTIRVFFMYETADTDGTRYYLYYITSVTPSAEVTLESLAENTLDYDKAFDTSRQGAKFNREYRFDWKPAYHTSNKDLLEAITAKIGTKLEGNVQSFIRPNGGGVDLELQGTANRYGILNVSDNGYEEYSISIRDSSNGHTEIENLNNGKYYTYSENSGTYSGQYLDENSGKDKIELPAVEQIAAVAGYKRYAAN